MASIDFNETLTFLCPPSGGAGEGGSWGGLVGWDEEEIVEAAARLYQDRVSPYRE